MNHHSIHKAALQRRSRGQQGFTLIEGLIAILVFSIGIVGMLGMQSTAINLSTDARYRSQAAFLADQLIATVTVSDPAVLGQIAHYPSDPASGASCDPQGTASTHATVTAWLAEVAAGLPNAPADIQQVKVDVGAQTMEVTVCWQVSGGEMHHHTVVNYLQM